MKHIQLFGTIGKGFDFFTGTESLSATWLASELKGAGEVVIQINSDGGDLFEAVAMMELIRAHTGGTTSRVMALAASSASFLMLAADRVEMAPGSQLMIHNPYTTQTGYASELRETADLLDHLRNTTVVPAYESHSNLSTDEIVAMMDDETWIDAEQAIEFGFSDGMSISETEPVAALLRVGITGKAPRGFAPLEAKAYRAELKSQLDAVRRIPLERQRANLHGGLAKMGHDPSKSVHLRN